MAAIWKQDTTNYFVIGTNRDLPAITDWKVYSVDLSNGTVNDETAKVTVAEITQTIGAPATGTVLADTLVGSKTLTLGAGEGAGFSKGMKISYTAGAATEYNSVKSVAGDTLTLRTAILGGTVVAASAVNQTGKTGDYTVTVVMSALNTTMAAGGKYQFQVTSANGDIDITSEIFDVSDYSVKDDLGADIAYLKAGVDAAGGSASATIYI